MFLFNTVRSTLLTLATCVGVGAVFHVVVTEPARAFDYTIDMHTPNHGTLHTPDGGMHPIHINDYSYQDDDLDDTMNEVLDILFD